MHSWREAIPTFVLPNPAGACHRLGSYAREFRGKQGAAPSFRSWQRKGSFRLPTLQHNRLQKLSLTTLLCKASQTKTAVGAVQAQRWEVFFKLAAFVRPHQQKLLVAGIFTGSSSLFLLWLVQLFGQLTSAVAAGCMNAVGHSAYLCCMVLMLRVAAQFGQDVLLARVCTSVEDDLRTRYVASAMCYRLVQERLDAGEAAIQATMEVERISNAILLVLRSIVPSILQFMVMLGYMVYVSPLLTACILLTAPLMAFVYASLERRLDQSIRTTQKLFAHYAAHAADSFRNRLLLQLYLAQTFAESKLQAIAMNVMQAKIRMHTLRASIIPAVSICYMITVLTMLYVSALCISKGLLYPKELVSFLASVAFLIEPVQGIASGLGNIKEGEESARRVFRVIEKSPQMGFTKPMIHLRQAVAYEIALSNVWFRYSADSDYVLRDVSMTARPGERIAIVGGSGAGKSTLVSLLSRMYDPQKGSIYLDGIDLRDLPHEEIRQRICVVPQDAPMLNWSVRENVSFGLPMEQEKVEQCCRLANAHEFIVNNLPNAYDTEVGEGGSNLSGGQRQRIAIARALYRDPGVLILDEACSALDAENENLVQNALRELFESSNNPRTTIFIAHRLASVRYADRIVVMENGSIVEDGTHEELVDMKNSRYGTLLAMQQGDL